MPLVGACGPEARTQRGGGRVRMGQDQGPQSEACLVNPMGYLPLPCSVSSASTTSCSLHLESKQFSAPSTLILENSPCSRMDSVGKALHPLAPVMSPAGPSRKTGHQEMGWRSVESPCENRVEGPWRQSVRPEGLPGGGVEMDLTSKAER